MKILPPTETDYSRLNNKDKHYLNTGKSVFTLEIDGAFVYFIKDGKLYKSEIIAE